MSENESKFNLWKEPWICVLTKEQKIIEVSLEDALINSQDYIDLAGELPTQNFAILRLLLALVHTIFFRKSPDEPQDAWFELWNKKCFAKEPIINYKNQWLDRFFLFDKKHPFYQEPKTSDVNKGNNKEDKTKPVEKLNGEISESAHKKRLFLLREGNEKNSLSFSEAARWLIHNNCYDDTSLKNPSPKIGWCGQLWGIFARGDNLFQTLMLNLILWKDAIEPWNENKPWWECDKFYLPANKKIEDYEIKIPDNPAELYSLQHRFVSLEFEDNLVTGYKARSGCWFSNKNAFSEQMTLWEEKKEKNKTTFYIPKSTDRSVQIWREFSSILAAKENNEHSSGIINWIASLKEYLGRDYFVRFQTIAIDYDDNNSSIDNVYTDTIGLHIEILTELGRQWRNIISDEVLRCKKIAKALGEYWDNIQKTIGIDDDELKKNKNKKKQRDYFCEQFYYQIDIPFRNWVSNLGPNNYTTQRNVEIDNWHKLSRNIAVSLGKSILNENGGGIWSNRVVDEKKGKKLTGKKFYYSFPHAFNILLSELKRIDQGSL